jgi:hypothetical protein
MRQHVLASLQTGPGHSLNDLALTEQEHHDERQRTESWLVAG